ncbi:MAG: hypothetical protein KKD77_21740 [Gammaproteobacteria bacterium]|nr:hypothetical protein [Gammaproteobacteria bacterium]
MEKPAVLVAKLEQLRFFVDKLQEALGWYIEIVKRSKDDKDYEVTLRFTLTYKGRAWPDIVSNPDMQSVLVLAVQNKIETLWEAEKKRLENGNGNGKTKVGRKPPRT